MQSQNTSTSFSDDIAEVRKLTERCGRWKNAMMHGGITKLAGCYALVGNGECYYIGQSRCIADRIVSHGWVQTSGGVRTKKWGLIPGAVIKTRASERGDFVHLTLEAKLIERLRPEFNRGRFVKTKRNTTDREGVVAAPVYAPMEGEKLISLSEVADYCKLPINTIRLLLSRNIVEAVPDGIIEWLFDQSKLT